MKMFKNRTINGGVYYLFIAGVGNVGKNTNYKKTKTPQIPV